MINARYVDGLELRIKELSKKLSDESNNALHLIAENKSLKEQNAALAAQVEVLKKSNGKKFTAALNVIDTDYHITLCFDDCRKASKVSTSTKSGEATVIDVVYWKHCDLTVALVKSDFCDERAEYWAKNGYGYELGYKPHFTLGKGDCASLYKCMVGKVYKVGDEYCRVFAVSVDTTPTQCLAAHLAEIRAEVGRAGFIAGCEWFVSLDYKKRRLSVREAANQYADQIRQEVE